MLRRLVIRAAAGAAVVVLRRVRLRLERELAEMQLKMVMEAMSKMPPTERTIVTLGSGFYDLSRLERLRLIRRALREKTWN